MRRMFLSGSLLAAALMLAVPASAQDTKTARGTVTAMTGDSITVKAGTQDVKVTVDAKTEVIAEGGGTASRAAAAKGTAGPKLAELVKVGDNVEVSYRETGGMMHATSVRRVSSPGPGGGGVSEKKKTATSSGVVTAVSGTSLTISGSSGGGGKFTQSFTIDSNTHVVAEGAGTASAKGKVTITDLVSKGDNVTVTYQEIGTSLHATEVRKRNAKS
jgi:hypothetical protein